MAIFSRTTGALPSGNMARIGEIATAVKMIIKSESDALSKKEGAAEWLYNVEKSYHSTETIITEKSLGLLKPVEDGGIKELLSRQETMEAVIRHFEISGVETIQAAMLEDTISQGKIGSQIKRMARNMAESYYRSRNTIATLALTGGLSTSYTYEGRSKSIKLPDGKALFVKDHKVGVDGDTQSNCFYTVRASGVGISATLVDAILGQMAIKLRNMLDENGNSMGYDADTIVIPSNAPALEIAVKTALASISTSSSAGAMSGDTNIQYDNWRLIIPHTWKVSAGTECPMIIMSSEANKRLGGNMFFDRTPLRVKTWIDEWTDNLNVSARARVGIGFGTYKHALLYESIAYSGTDMFDGSTASTVGTSVTI